MSQTLRTVTLLASAALACTHCGGAQTGAKVGDAHSANHAPAHNPNDGAHHGMHAKGDPGHAMHGKSGHGQDGPHAAGEMHGATTVASNRLFTETVQALERAIADKGLKKFHIIDHSANAKAAGVGVLRPTVVVVFGNPAMGTKLMQATPTMGLSLPLKMLVYQADDGAVRIVYESPKHLVHRHGAKVAQEMVAKISAALAGLAEAAAGPAPTDTPVPAVTPAS